MPLLRLGLVGQYAEQAPEVLHVLNRSWRQDGGWRSSLTIGHVSREQQAISLLVSLISIQPRYCCLIDVKQRRDSALRVASSEPL